nr:MAG TPA: hypothetical protein [Caudoviricetes sp.]
MNRSCPAALIVNLPFTFSISPANSGYFSSNCKTWKLIS